MHNCAAIGLSASTLLATSAMASQVTYRFTTTVQTVNSAAPGFPASLAGVTVGSPVTGRVTYEGTSPSAANSFPLPYSLATYYPLNNSAVTLTINGVTLSTWTGPHVAFVWNNELIGGAIQNDGLLFNNLAQPGSIMYRVGNLGLATSTLANEALPTTNLTGGYVLEMWTSGGSAPWIRTVGWSGFTLAPPCPADISPSPPNGSVNVDDLLSVINSWGVCGNPTNCPADIWPAGGNDIVNLDDLLAVINGWGGCP